MMAVAVGANDRIRQGRPFNIPLNDLSRLRLVLFVAAHALFVDFTAFEDDIRLRCADIFVVDMPGTHAVAVDAGHVFGKMVATYLLTHKRDMTNVAVCVDAQRIDCRAVVIFVIGKSR